MTISTFQRYEGLVGQSYTLPDYNYDCQRTINRYPEYDETQLGKNKEPAHMIPTPGLVTLISGLEGYSRDGYVTGSNTCYWVFGNTLYLIKGTNSLLNWTATALGTLPAGGSAFTIPVSTTTSFGEILTLGSITGGSGYTNGTYTTFPMTGGTGSGATATVVISGGAVTSVTLTTGGTGYTEGDLLTITPSAHSSINGTTMCQFAENAYSLFITCADVGTTYIVDLTTNAISIGSSPALGDGWQPFGSITYFDSFVVFSQKNTNVFWWTDPNASTINGLNFAPAITNADHIVSVFSNNESLWVFGQNTTELWYNASAVSTTNTFQRTAGVLVETGGASPYTIEKLNNTLFWLATDQRGGPIVYMANGYQPIRVSTFAVENALSEATADNLALATADAMTYNGHYWYVLNVPGLTSTWVFDMTSYIQSGKATWFEQQSGYGPFATRHIAQGHAYFNGYNLRGHVSDGKLMAMVGNFYTEDGQLVTRTRVAPHVTNGFKRVRYNSLQVDYMTGSTINPWVNPQAWLDYSDDGGKTYSVPQLISLGNIGAYTQRVIFYQLGVSRNRVFRLTDCFDGYSAISGGELNYQTGAN